MSKPILIVHNAHILTMGDVETAEAFAVDSEGRLIAVGKNSDVLNLNTAGVKTLDLNGKTVLPGFFDCHLHLGWLGDNLGHVDVSADKVKTKDDILRLLKARLIERPNSEIVQGSGYDQNRLPGGLHLTRQELDTVSADIPVRVIHTSGHAAVVNTLALQKLGYWTADNPTGGEIVRDEKGEPTGVLLETASWENLDRLSPPSTVPEFIDSLGRASDYLLSRGITSASDANTTTAQIGAYAQAAAQKKLRVRTNLMVSWSEIMRGLRDRSGVPTPDSMQPREPGVTWHEVHVGQAKLFSDGALTTRTAWLTQPFAGTTDAYGIPIHDTEELEDFILEAHLAGWQIATHAIGDKAIDTVLHAYAEAQKQKPRFRPGHRIEHAMLLDDDLISRFRRQLVWSIGQPEFIARLGDAYLTALGEERANRLSPYATLENQNVAQAFSSDCPVVPGAPLDGIRAALLRKTPSGYVLNKSECVSIETALYNYTTSPAYATQTDRDRGTLETGKLADFVILSENPREVPAEEFERVRVEATFVGGEQRYRNGAAE